MSEEVGVQPGRLSELASKLEQLREVLVANVPTIVSTLNEYWSSGQGTPINLSALQQAQGRSVDDAADIRARSNRATAWEHKANALLPDGMVSIPWNRPPSEPNAASAQGVAELLTQAEAEDAKDPKAARALIAKVGADIEQHLDAGDTAWLVAFYNQASPQVANLAATLNREDGQKSVDGSMPAVLTQRDQQILKTFATGLAYADKNGTLSSTAINAYAEAKNLWSVGMLFKFGPPGSAYGTQESGTPPNVTPNLLAKVTTAIELARMDGGYTIPLTGVSYNASGAAEVTQLLQEFDPSQVMLTLATQNGVAAREVLGDHKPLPPSLLSPGEQNIPIGQAIASGLMLRPTTEYYPNLGPDGLGALRGFYPDPVPTSYGPDGQPTDFNVPLDAQFHPVTISPGVIGNFFNAATSAPRGYNTAAYESAQSAMNIIDGTPPPSTASLKAPVRQALLNTAERYLLDLGLSCINVPFGGALTTSKVRQLGNEVGDPNAPYSIQIAAGKGSALQNFLQQVTSNPRDAGILMASAKMAFGKYYGLTVAGKLPQVMQQSDPAGAMAMLVGQIQTQADAVGIQDANARDAQNAEYNALLSFAESSATKIPVIGTAVGSAQTAASLLGINLPQFSVDNAADLQQRDAQNYALLQMSIVVPMTQGLIDEGVIPASSLKNQVWFHDGQIVLNNNNEYGAFIEWFGLHNRPTGDRNFGDDISKYQNDMNVQSAATNPNTPNPAAPSGLTS
jgi:hypothetical protein